MTSRPPLASVGQTRRRVLLILTLALAIAVPSWLYEDAVTQASSYINNQSDTMNLAAVSSVAHGIDHCLGEIREATRRLAADVRIAQETATHAPSAPVERDRILRDWLSSRSDVQAVYLVDRSASVIARASQQCESAADPEADPSILQGRTPTSAAADSWLVLREPVSTEKESASVVAIVSLNSIADLFTALPPWTDFTLQTNDGRVLFGRSGATPGVVIEIPTVAVASVGDAGISDARQPDDRSAFAQSVQLPAFVTASGSSSWTMSKMPLYVADTALFVIGSFIVLLCTGAAKRPLGGESSAMAASLWTRKRNDPRLDRPGSPPGGESIDMRTNLPPSNGRYVRLDLRSCRITEKLS